MIKRILSILLCVCMAITLLPTVALAVTEETLGGFTVSVESGDVSDVASYLSGVLTITGNCTIRNKDSTGSTSDRIVVNSTGNVTLNLNGVSITAPNGDTGADALTVTSGAVTLNIAADSNLKGGFGDNGNGGNGIAGNVAIIGTAKLTASGQQTNYGATAGSGISGNAVVYGSVHLEAVGGQGGSGSAGGSGVKGNVVVHDTATMTATGKFGYGSQSAAITGTITATGHAIMGSDDESDISNTITSGTTSNYTYVIVTLLPTAAEYAADAAIGTDYVVDGTATPKTLHVKTAKGAAWWSANGSSYLDYTVYLDADIDVSGFLWTPVGTTYTEFTGTFDGQGHSINGLNVEVTGGSYKIASSGMFGVINNAAIKNMKLIGASVVATSPQNEYTCYESISGAIVASTRGGSITNCFASGSVSASGGSTASAGGIVGMDLGNFTLTNCYSSCSVTSTNGYSGTYAGGIVGILKGELKNCYSIGKVQASGGGSQIYSHGLACRNYGDPLLKNCFYLTGTTPNSTTAGVGDLTAIGCGTFDSSGALTAGTETQFGTAQTLESYAYSLLNALNGWVNSTANTDYYTWVADNATTSANGGYPVFGPAWILQAQWGMAGADNAVPTTWVSSGSLTDAVAYANNLASGTAYIRLLNNVDNCAAQKFASGKTTILDLNGKTITAKAIDSSDDYHNILNISGQLTLCDSSNTDVTKQGKITGGHGTGNGSGGGVYVENTGTFIMTGGNITANTAVNGGGVGNEGTFTMTGGSIAGNSCTLRSYFVSKGGGVSNIGYFNMSGGSITGNTVAGGGAGGGVIDIGGGMTLSGNVNISGNKVGTASDNVVLIGAGSGGAGVNIAGALTNSTPIGVNIGKLSRVESYDVTLQEGIFTFGDAVTNSDYISKFVSDNSGFAVIADGSQLRLAAAQAITKTDATNGSFTVKVNGNEVPSATEGQIVTVTPTASSGYAVDTITVSKTGDTTTTVTVTNGSFTMPDYPVTVTVSFRVIPTLNKYVVTVNDGGTDATGAGSYAQGAPVNIYAGTRTNCFFTGWTVVSGGVTLINSNSRNACFIMPAGDVTVTANWIYYGGFYIPPTTYYTLTFDVNGGSAIASISKTSGTTVDLSAYIPTKTGYDFAGWYSDSALTTKITSVNLTNITTVYAKWNEQNPNTGFELPLFIDVSESDWFYEDVAFVFTKDLMKGTNNTTFAPYMTTSRGMIVTALYRLENKPGVTDACPFDDVNSGMYYENAIAWAASHNIVEGCGNGKFCPEDKITREQLAAILYRYAFYKGCDISKMSDISKFSDSHNISSYAVSPMKWAYANELMQGNDGGILDPGNNAQRCQVAAILHRFIKNIMK